MSSTFFSTAAPESRQQSVKPNQETVDKDGSAPLTPLHSTDSPSDVGTLSIEICGHNAEEKQTRSKYIWSIACVERSENDLDVSTEVDLSKEPEPALHAVNLLASDPPGHKRTKHTQKKKSKVKGK
jgi:hypothetical protein